MLFSSIILETPIIAVTKGFETLIEMVTGWPGTAVIFVYSFLIAFALPGPSEIVLIAPLELGL